MRRLGVGSSDLEVGILQPVPSSDPDEPEELSLSGYLTLFDSSTPDAIPEPERTTFSFPSRHHALPYKTSYSVAFQQPTGLHPKLDISFSRSKLVPPPGRGDSCALHAYLTLPSALFLDRYQLADPLFLESQNLLALRALSGGEDLEAPDWVVEKWGSAALFEVATPSLSPASEKHKVEVDGDWTITIPLHLRYLRPSTQSQNSTASSGQTGETAKGYTDLEAPWPILFFACPAASGTKFSTNPFDRTNLGFDGLFGPRTVFYHFQPAVRGGEGVLVEKLQVPVLKVSGVGEWWVQMGTFLVVGVGFGWVLWVLVLGSGILDRRGGKEKAQ